MADEEQLAILKQGVDVWNKWREDNQGEVIDLSGADLRDVDFFFRKPRFAELRGAKFHRVNLSDANLTEADLTEADLRKADLSRADLSDARLNQAVLSGACLYEAKLHRADLSLATLRLADLRGAELWDTNLTRADLVETYLTNATLTGCKIYGISAWDLKLEGAEQSNLVITRFGQPTVMVDDLEVAQFIYMLLNREKLRNVLSAMTQKGVLILGRFKDGGLEVLQAVAEKIRELGYLPMLFDFEASESRDFTETVKVMVGLARFVIADLSGPSVLKELEATVPDFEVPFIPIIEEGRHYPSMTSDLTKHPWFRWPPFEFSNKEMLVEMLPGEVIAPALEIGKKREERRAILFPDTDTP